MLARVLQMGIEDATVLADSLLNNPPPENDGGNFRPALEEYARRRVPRSKKVASMASWSGVLSMGEKWYWRWIRDLGARLPAGGDPKEYVLTLSLRDLSYRSQFLFCVANGLHRAKKPVRDPTSDWLFQERIVIKEREGLQ